MSNENTRAYYDEFAKVYEKHRHAGYHRFLDDSEFALLEPYACDRDVLEAGCGTGLLLERAARVAKSARGVDLSPGMLQVARERGLDVREADLCALPFPDASFDTVYSFKVLAHVEAIEAALAELARVVRPGGHLLLEFYNARSLRGLIKALKPATPIGETRNDEDVYTRFDTLGRIRAYAPDSLDYVTHHGLRVFTPFARVHDFAPSAAFFRALERGGSGSPLKAFGGFLVVVFRKK